MTPWILLLAGLGIAVFFSGGSLGGVPWEVPAAVLAAAAIPRVQELVLGGLEIARHPSPRQARRVAFTLGALAAAFLLFTAVRQDRGFHLRLHDEFSYLIQAQMLARGRLWMPAHPMAPFFDSFQLLAEPVYASVYFPGTALLSVPGIWLHWPAAAIPLLTSGAIVGLFYLIVTELLDGAAGILAALMLVSLSMFRALSIMLLAQGPMLLFGLAMTWAWLMWRRSRSVSWAAALGAFAGWAAITRPLDAVCYAAPIGLAMLAIDFRARPAAEALIATRAIVLAALPFLTLQFVFNVGVTGNPLTTPFGYYAERDNPQTYFGFHDYDPTLRPASSLPQKQVYHRTFTAQQIQAHTLANLATDWIERRLTWTLLFGLPHLLLAALVPAALLGLRDTRLLVLVAPLPLLLVGYSFYGFFLSHYVLTSAPALIVCVLVGARDLERAWPRRQRLIATAAALFVATLSLTNLPVLNPDIGDNFYPAPNLRVIHEKLPGLVKPPAVVLFTFSPGDGPHEEPVYNTDVAWPDDAPIVRAHDRGAADMELVRYFAKSQPDRTFYLYNRSGHFLLTLGRADSLAERGTRGQAPAPGPGK